MEENGDERIMEKWVQSTDQAMPEAHTTSRLFSFVSNKSFLFIKPVYFPHKPICMFTTRVVACEEIS